MCEHASPCGHAPPLPLPVTWSCPGLPSYEYRNIIIDVFAATSIVVLCTSALKFRAPQRACASLSTSCHRCSDSFGSIDAKHPSSARKASDSFASKLNVYPSSARIRVSKLNTRSVLGFVCLNVKLLINYPSSARIRVP